MFCLARIEAIRASKSCYCGNEALDGKAIWPMARESGGFAGDWVEDWNKDS